jgi:chromosome segregation ATPase
LAVNVMAEGTQRPGGEPPRSEQDLLADRRARRASESGEASLVRRAEVAEATVQTLETHLASLQQRVRDAEEESRRTAELIESERTAPSGEQRGEGSGDVVLEYELRRARQRSHVERQLRIEAEDRYVDLERESRAEIDRLLRRLSASEREVGELAARFDALQQELAHAQQAATGRGAAEQRAETELRERLAELEQHAAEIQRGLDSERAARARSEEMLEDMTRSHHQMQAIVGDLRTGFARLSVALSERAEPLSQPLQTQPAPVQQSPGGEMADALAAAVVRLRDRAEEAHAGPLPELLDEEHEAVPLPTEGTAEAPSGETAHTGEAAQSGPGAGGDTAVDSGLAADSDRAEPLPRGPAYKHSMSLIGRLRLARKQRRARA